MKFLRSTHPVFTDESEPLSFRKQAATLNGGWCMNSFFRQALIALVIPTLIIVGINGMVFAAGVNPQIANISYWYGDDDIRAVIKSRLGDSVYIAPAVPNNSELIRVSAAAALAEVQAGKPALIPVNLSNNHWTGIAIRMKADGNIIVFYNDSFGTPVGGESSESGQYIAAIKTILPTAEIVDLRVHQQNDGSSCGAFTAENLIALAGQSGEPDP